jgi:glycerol-3-phosphate O-acyltransferase
MATITKTPPHSGGAPGAAPKDGPPVVLADSSSAVERELIARFIDAEHRGAELRFLTDPTLAERLEAGDDPLLLPVRVVWLPRERDGDRRAGVADLLALTNPRRPRERAQRRIVQREPDRSRVVSGEPARASELRQAWHEETHDRGGAAGFALFVARRAKLALERAERAVVGDRYKIPRLVADQIMDSARFREAVTRAAAQQGTERAPALAHARKSLEELAAVQSRLAIDLFRYVMSPLHARAWTPEVDVATLERLRELGRHHSLVFLPSHRSYSDPLVLGAVLHDHDFPPNQVLGGNNMSFWPIGPLGKRAGIVFIRRSFGDDAIYKLAVREYFGHLVAKRFNIEWYIEGGRTRTGKLRPPKYGLLSYLVSALEDGRAEDVILVPTSIVYDQLREIREVVAEQSGGKKRSEGVRWLADYARAQRSRVGKVQIRFGEPLSLRQRLADAGTDNQLEKVAFAICDGINRTTPLSATSFVTLALLGVRDRALTLEQVAAVLEPLLDDVERRQLKGCDVPALRDPEAIKRVLQQLAAERVVTCYAGGTEPVYAIEPGQHHVAAFYRNGAVHWFVNRAIVELCILAVAERGSQATIDAARDPVEEGFDEALRLRDLLKFEFFFATKEDFRSELRVELDFVDPAWTDRIGSRDEVAALLTQSGSLLAHRVLRSFIDAQLVVAERLAAHAPGDAIETDALLRECLGVGRQLLLQGRLHGPESVSRELFSSALRLAANRGLLDPGGEELKLRREEFAAELRDIAARTWRIADLDAEARKRAFDAKMAALYAEKTGRGAGDAPDGAHNAGDTADGARDDGARDDGARDANGAAPHIADAALAPDEEAHDVRAR